MGVSVGVSVRVLVGVSVRVLVGVPLGVSVGVSGFSEERGGPITYSRFTLLAHLTLVVRQAKRIIFTKTNRIAGRSGQADIATSLQFQSFNLNILPNSRRDTVTPVSTIVSPVRVGYISGCISGCLSRWLSGCLSGCQSE